ncbi:MAG TPA: hypothetical protein VKU82_09365, partial [Planctomycetaceae bacterium]|nr:hypothetical protein [Planctomycetaceae bacterium]
MFELKPLAPERIPAALEKAERYRLLNEPVDAESICRDILLIEHASEPALISLLLALTDQFSHGQTDAFPEARSIAGRLAGEYHQNYYLGIVYERRAKAHYCAGKSGSGAIAYDWFVKAMECYEKASATRPADNDESLLRWNT